MLFNSESFVLGFLPTVLAGYFLLGRIGGARVALGFLVGSSLFFYGWWNPPFVLLLAGSIIANYAIGQHLLALAQARQEHAAGRWLAFGVTANLLLLGWFKYAGFLARSIAAAFGAQAPELHIFLPLAISFFTFQQIMFLADSRRRTRPDGGFLGYAAFVAFFPHLIAGPIVPPAEIIPQLLAPDIARPRRQALCDGATIFLLGLAKKLVLADMFARFADIGFNAAAHGARLSFFSAWYAVLAYALQIYFDFSGYSDMAIGLARMLNVRFPLNFDSPYQSRDIAGFWRSWHITLGGFLRDYLYIPLGGSRCGEGKRARNLLLTMLLCGLWHGAAWRFVLWGGLHGVFLAIHAAWRRTGTRLPGAVAQALTLLAVVAAWVPFRATGMGSALSVLGGMAGLHGVALPAMILRWLQRLGLSALGFVVRPVPLLAHLGAARTLSFPEVSACLALGWVIVLALPHVHEMSERTRSLALIASFALTIQGLFFAPKVVPFLYFRF
ncbi:MAG: MBOAT family protein [Rhodospirillales bacterium]|nr:MBOAT family protein [Rhodospirillales bacterium]